MHLPSEYAAMRALMAATKLMQHRQSDGATDDRKQSMDSHHWIGDAMKLIDNLPPTARCAQDTVRCIVLALARYETQIVGPCAITHTEDHQVIMKWVDEHALFTLVITSTGGVGSISIVYVLSTHHPEWAIRIISQLSIAGFI